MKIIYEIPKTPLFATPSVLTIGMFDGMHPGHQAVIRKLVEKAKQTNQQSVVISYINHPLEVLRPDILLCKICTLEHKTRLLEKMGVDVLILLTFTKDFSLQTASEFLHQLSKIVPFSSLVLGWDATLGRDKHGNKEILRELANKMHFLVEHLDEQKIQETIVSSSQIRKYIQAGNLDEVQKLLGRKYSIYSKIYKGEGKGKKIGFPTANFNVEGLCLPPMGVYAVTCIIDEIIFEGIANLGVAPTLREDKIPTLEVHIFDFNENLYEKEIEVIFSSYLRPEKKFANVEELKNQIHKDILQTRQKK